MAMAEQIADDLIELYDFNGYSFTATDFIRDVLIEAARAGGAPSDADHN